MKKVLIKKGGRKHWSRREFARPSRVRRETNQEIMHQSILHLGYVHIRLQPQMYHWDTRTYAGYHGAAIAIDVDEIEQAGELIERVHETVRQYAQERGLAAPKTSRPRAFGW